ncbi:MAG: ABC transporter ATP-binding protein/permease [Anaerolineae bacterium]|nr:ABC transporter ATP-binding protein/permease [Anaerolineae bacterium]
MAQRSEFTVPNTYPYNRSSPIRWIFSHIWRYKYFFIATCGLYLTAWFSYSYGRILIGAAAEEIINPTAPDGLLKIAFAVLFILALDSLAALGGSLSVETIAQRLERDSREELYISLLGKSQTFHDRQRVGDIMARATDDMKQMNAMINPGVLFIAETVLGLSVPLLMMATIRLELLLVPLVFIAVYIVTVRAYSRRLNPVVTHQREAFGIMNAGLEETISGIEVVKASAQEPFERGKFYKNARKFRDYFAEQGRVEAGYLPMLFYGFALGFGFLHCMVLYQQGFLSIPEIIAVMGLLGALRFPIFISIFSFSLVQLGIASAHRILHIINAEAELDENAGGYAQPMKGEIVFDNVSFGYEDGMVLENISFRVKPGETVAIVGQTGSGKSTLTELINRTYDATGGQILIDGVDVADWNLTALRSQISKIEQDVFLFSRTLAENIAFGAPDTPQQQIEQAAREAQAHNFIKSFANGYETEVGERGVTLSGGQRQRIALARAFLSNPRVLILDDSTSAIDSATEDEIQQAIRRAQQGRTTLLITHRLSQIRWADHILLLEGGRLIAGGTHEELLRSSAQYRRIFARYDVALPPVEATTVPSV